MCYNLIIIACYRNIALTVFSCACGNCFRGRKRTVFSWHLLPKDFADRCVCRCQRAAQRRKEVIRMADKKDCGCGCIGKAKRKARTSVDTKKKKKIKKHF